tara:strand:- start:217 stop:372 length:156 start_codon:yes stop_codon:yes gene_type:complete
VDRAFKDVIGIPNFDDAAQVHDGNHRRDVSDNTQVVTDEEIGKSQSLLEFL